MGDAAEQTDIGRIQREVRRYGPLTQAAQDHQQINPAIGTQRDWLAVEEPLEIRLRWTEDAAGTTFQEQAISITMRTPGQDAELAIGFLHGEGILRRSEDLEAAFHDDRFCASGESSNALVVRLRPGRIPDTGRLQRHFYTTSSCGVCGKGSLEAVRQTVLQTRAFAAFDPAAESFTIKAQKVAGLPEKLRQHQGNFSHTGGLHAAGLFDRSGNLLALREDVGRHNAVDKLIGWAFQKNVFPLDQHILMLSGRASFELIQKAAAAGIAVVCAVGAPSSLAVDLARDQGITLLGFVRDGRFNAYCGEQRILA